MSVIPKGFGTPAALSRCLLYGCYEASKHPKQDSTAFGRVLEIFEKALFYIDNGKSFEQFIARQKLSDQEKILSCCVFLTNNVVPSKTQSINDACARALLVTHGF